MKIAVATALYFGSAIVGLLEDAGYDYAPSVGYANGEDTYVTVNTDKKTFKDASDAGDRVVYNPATQWAAIQAIITGVAPVAAATPTAAPAAAATTSNGIAVGDQVRASNSRKTKANFRLDTARVYTVARITAKGNIGLEGLPNDEYLATRFTKVATTTGSSTAAPVAQVRVETPTTGTHSGYVNVRIVPAIAARDERNNVLHVGDKVLVRIANPRRRDRKFVLAENRIFTVSEVTAKGNVGFGGADQYKANRFRKVTLSAAGGNVRSGDLVVASPRRDGTFALPENTALTFRGVTVEGGSYILDGYTTDQYAASRFQKVNLVG